MKLLSTISPMLLDESEVIIKVTKQGENLKILVQPKLLNGEPETDDETLANLQAAFQLPMAITVPGAPDPDQALANALAEFGTERKEAVSDLEAYRESIQASRAAAKKAEDEKKEKAAKQAAEKADKANSGKKGASKAKTATKGAATTKGRTGSPEPAGAAIPAATKAEPAAEQAADLFSNAGAAP